MAKEDIRMSVWRLMEEKGIAMFPRPIFHRIPNFVGAEKAAQNLRELPDYKVAKMIFCNPDSPQKPVREAALRDGKVVFMATPRLKKGFLLLDPNVIHRNNISRASTIRGAFKHGRLVEPSEVKVDLFVAGSVAVSPDGGRLGKGAGYSDQEHAILRNSGGLTPETPVVTTVHDVQVVEKVPREEWDVCVDVIVTPTRVIRVTRGRSGA
ncbi:MAG: 5-formyltetrahydrofolate cyclo-ligase [Candidatus Bathyarchaeota archaeon]|nr:5-formyltetrahydrofolate cyclo-ligase [Candidatus Bathyarchaeota archaeon]